jgi:hypothetical protein
MKKLQRNLSKLLLCVLVLSILALPACGASTNAVQDAKEGVVCVYSDYILGYGYGSGICVGNADEPVKYVVTNRHVIDGAYRIRVLVDGKEHTVTDYYEHNNVDLAVLVLDSPITTRHAMVLGDASNVNETDKVYAIGFRDIDDVSNIAGVPSNINDMTVPEGTVVRKSIEFMGSGECVQTSVSISHGNSGGPLITQDGQVIAVNCYGTSNGSVTTSYSLNVRYAKELLTAHGIPFITEAKKSVNLPLIIALIAVGALMIIGGVVAIILVSVKSKKKKAAAAVPPVQNYVDPNYAAPNYQPQVPAGPNYQQIPGQNYQQAQIPGAQQNWGNAYPVQNEPVVDLGVTEAAPPETGTIKVLAGSMRGAEIPIRDGETLWVGKDAKSCNVVFDPSFTHISRMHCSVTYNAQSDRYIVVDESTNGTYLENGTRLPKHERRPLSPGTTLRLAKDGNCVRLG